MFKMVRLSGLSVALSMLSPAVSLPSSYLPMASHAMQISTLVDLGYSTYQGTVLSSGVNQYLGMRFAAAPVGDLRFRAPQDPPQTNGTQAADAFGPICLGTPNPFLEAGEEDCLFLNVWAPSNATANPNLPVWFFIQGGGYTDDENANYNGTEVIVQSNHSIVMVNMNYRTGAFGFLGGRKVQHDGDLNAGLLDQRKALQWVQQYIHRFGGDPSHVVIHGDSAGAGSVAHLLTAYGGRNDGLFAGAIAESTFWPTQRTIAETEFQFNHFARNVSCDPDSKTVMSCLRSKNTTILQSADYNSPFPNTTTVPEWYWLPIIDGDLNQDLLYNLFDQGKVIKVPAIIGDDTSEGNGFAANAATNEEFLAFIQDNYPHLTEADLLKINSSYPMTAPFAFHNAWFGAAALAYGDSTFTCPGIEMSNSLSKYFKPGKVWNYHYDVVDPQGAALGDPVPHTTELPAIFGPESTYCGNCSYASGNVNAPMVPIVMSYWISFIKALNPNTYRLAGQPVWKPWGSAGYKRLHFLLKGSSMETVPKKQKDRCELWKSLAKTMEQ